jgi:uncharacterized protein (DUF4415 family)
MTANATTKRLSLTEITAAIARGEDATRADAPEADAVGDKFWANSVVIEPEARKTSMHLRLNAEVREWFRAQGPGHLTRMNAVLSLYYGAKKGR